MDGQERNVKREVRVLSEDLETLRPFLSSVLLETQPLVAIGTLHRRVLEDTKISASKDGRKYLLKKGRAVFLPVISCHRNESVWGEAQDIFRLGRFQRDIEHPDSEIGGDKVELAQFPVTPSPELREKAYFPFGGGKELCPGRHLAVAETLRTLVILVLGFEITALDGTMINLPPFAAPKMTAQTARPREDTDMRAQITRRRGWEDVD